jgi:hypothetical protein
MSEQSTRTSRNTAGIVCTVLGGMLSLWVVARLSSTLGRQQTWAPPFAPYEWVTLVGAVGAAALLIVGLLRWTASVSGQARRRERASTSER